MNILDQLKKLTTIVADTSDFNLLKKYRAQDATTNPSLIFKAAAKEEYEHLLIDALEYAKNNTTNDDELFDLALDKVFVNFGKEILQVIPGRISIEVDARLSFDTQGSVKKAKQIINLFEEENILKDRIYIKLASTFEGIEAAKILEKEGVKCNMTLLFSLEQAILCAEANVAIISPFVGRILDWHKNNTNEELNNDPGVVSVANIYNYYKKHDIKTKIMAASFRNIQEIIDLAGCDLLTISPNLLSELQEKAENLTPKLSIEKAKSSNIEKIKLDEKAFRYLLNQNEMASHLLAKGIRLFVKDIEKLEKMLASKLSQAVISE